MTNRDILAQSAGSTELERNKIKAYQEKLELSRKQSRILAEANRQISELSTANDPKNKEKIRELKTKVIEAKNRRDILETQLRRMENGVLAPLIEREKGRVLEMLRNEYGTIPKGEKAVRDDSLPVSTDGTNKVSRTTRTVKGAGVTPDDFAELIDTEVAKGGLTYIPITNSETVQKATKHIEEVGWEAAKAQATVLENRTVAKNATTAEKTTAVGKVHFDRKGRTFNEMQETALTTMEQLSAALGVEFYVYESYVNDGGKRVYKDADGNEVPAPNGWYDQQDGSIHIDLNAGQDGRGAMLFTVAHELTHFIREWSPAKFKVLANFLVKQYGEKGVSVSELVKRQMDKAKRNGRELTWEEAHEEMVADSMETMLTDGNVVQVMADLKQQDKGLWEKIKDWFRDLAEKLQRGVDAYKGVQPDTAEGRMVADMQDVIVMLESLYADALVDASENFQRAEKNTTSEGGDSLYSLREFGDGTRFVDVQMDAKVFDGMTVAEMNKAAKTILMERFAGKVIGMDNRVFVNGDSVNEYLHPSKSIDMDTRKAKLTAAGELDNLLDAGTALPNRPDGADGHIHPDAIDFSYFRTIFKVGNEYFEGIVNIKNNKRGKLLKDVTKIRNITQDIVSSYGDNPKSNFLRDVSMYSIRNDGGKVNKKFSDREAALQHFGRTYSWKETGYLLTNGAKLDFSGRHEGASGGYRTVDHRDILVIYPEDTELGGNGAMVDFMKQGNIRIMPEGNGINLSVKPTKAQEQALDDFISRARGEVTLDIDDERGNTIVSVEYPRFTRASKVLQDIRNYFDTGVEPTVSQIAQFRYSDRDYGGIREVLAKKGLDELSERYGNRFPLSASFDATIRGDNTPLVMETVVANGVKRTRKESPFKVGRKAFTSTYGAKTIVHIDQMDIDVELYTDVANESISKAIGQPNEQSTLDVIPHIREILGNSILMGVERIVHTYNKGTALYGYRLYNLYWYDDGKAKTPHALACTVVQDLNKAEGYVFQNIENVAIGRGLPGAKAGMSSSVNGNTHTVAQLYEAVKRIVRSEGGLKYSPEERKKYLFNYTERADGRKYSDRDPAAGRVNEVLQKENTQLKEDVQYLKELLKIQKTVTNGTKFTKTSVEVMASMLMKGNNVKGDKKELAKLLNAVYEYIAKGEDLTWEGVAEMAQPAVDWLRSHTVIRSELSQCAKDVLHDVRTTRVSLDESQQAEAAYRYGSFNDFRKAMMGSIVIAKDGVPLDIQWQEWASTYPDVFDVNMSASDMPGALADVISSLRNSDLSRAEYAYHADMIAQDLLQQVYDGYWRVSTLRTVADVKQHQINELKGKHYQKMNNLRQFHLEKTDQLKREHRADMKRIRQEYREASERKQKQIIERYQESRKKATEGRNKTAMRHKIQRLVDELNRYLLHGTKERHVPEGLQKAVAGILDSLNMEVRNEEQRRESFEATLARYDRQIAMETDPEKVRQLIEKRRAYEEKGDQFKTKMEALKLAYDEIQNSEDPLLSNAYDDGLSAHMMTLIVEVGDTPLGEMSLKQLECVYDVCRIVQTTIRNANKAFKAAKNASIAELGNRVMQEVGRKEKGRKYDLAAMEAIRKFGWNNLKPVYAFEAIGSDTFAEIFNNVRKGEDVWALDVTEAREFYLEKAKKYGYDSWDYDKRYTFESTSGMEFSLSLEQIMSLYAYSKREQAADHLRKGGIVFDESTEVAVKTKLGIKAKFNPTEATAYNISLETLADIVSELTEEQKGYVDEMQEYLSTVMGNKGNEVSMEMYGIKLFKEKFYFPLKSASQFMAKAKEQQQGEVKIKNSGFSKETTKKASNPIVLTPFMNVWADHVNEMSMYHAFVLPMEDFYRVYNYRTATSDMAATESVEMHLQNAFGKGATKYIDQLLKDLNGGARTDSTAGVINRMMGMFKKGAVFASASVVVQQPSAIARAAAIVDTKYFIGPKVDHKRHKQLWEEVKQYAPVAIIKEMGYFDTNMGKSTQDFILGKEYSGFSEKMKALVTDGNYRDEVLSKAPALADEIAWCSIWEAVKRETLSKYPTADTRSELFLEKAGERFTEVIVKTQVYDSVLSRSANMRSKDTGMKMATAFMAEPTTSINMIADALMKGKQGTVQGRKYCRRTIGAVIASQILNAFLVSFVYAARDDDEEETYWEKYAGSFTAELLDGMNPLTYIPFIKDMVSIAQGYTVERSDMAVISDLWNAWKQLKSDEISVWRKVEGFVGSICQIFGLPVKNIMRDMRAVWQAFDTVVNGEDTTLRGVGYAVREAVTSKGVSNYEQLYEARLAGDAAHEARVEGRYDDEDSANAAVRLAIKNHFMDGQIDTQTALRQMVLYTGMDASEAHWLMDAWEYRKAMGTDEGYSMYNRFFEAVRTGENLKAVIKEYTDNDVKETTLTSMITKHFKPEYIEMSDSERKDIRNRLLDAYERCGVDQEEAEERLADWEFEAKYGFDYSDRRKAYLEGTVSAAQLKSILVAEGGYTAEDAAYQIKAYDWETQGYEDVTLAAVRAYEQFCEAAGVPKGVFLHIREFSNNTENDVDEEGKTVYYSAMKKVMAEINAQNLTAEQKTALAQSMGWSEKNIKKYKLW